MTGFVVGATASPRSRRKRRPSLPCRCMKWKYNSSSPCYGTRGETAPAPPRFLASAARGCGPSSSAFKFPWILIRAPKFADVLPHHDQPASDDQNQTEHGQDHFLLPCFC